MTIKTIISDLGNVIAMYEPGTYVDCLRTLPSVQRVLPKGEDELERLETNLWNIQHYFEMGWMSEHQYRQYISQRLQLPFVIGYRTMRRVFYDVFCLNVRVRDLWLQLRDSGLTMIAISNLCQPHHQEMIRIGVMEPFDHEILSYQEGTRKPSTKLMAKALSLAGVEGREAAFIDDRPENLIPAEELGMRTHCFGGSYDTLCRFLKCCGVKIEG